MASELLDAASGKQNITVAIKEITGATKTATCRLTVLSHGWLTGQLVRIWGAVGMVEINDSGAFTRSPDDGLLYNQITKINDDTIDLDGVDATLFGSYVSGGYVTPGVSLFEDAIPPMDDGDTAIVDLLTSPDSHSITFNPDGTLSFDAGGSNARQYLNLDVYDISSQGLHGDTLYWFNNIPPSLISTALPEQFWTPDIVIVPITLSDFIEDFEGDSLNYVVTGLPSGVAETNGIIAGTTPITESSGIANVRAIDITNDFTDFSMTFSVLLEEEEEFTQQTELPIFRPQMRSIDAQTLADRFNQGTPEIADYTFPGGRKFYQ